MMMHLERILCVDMDVLAFPRQREILICLHHHHRVMAWRRIGPLTRYYLGVRIALLLLPPTFSYARSTTYAMKSCCAMIMMMMMMCDVLKICLLIFGATGRGSFL